MVIMNSCGDIKRALSLCDCNTFDQLFDRAVAIQRYSLPASSYHLNEEAYSEALEFQYPVQEHVEAVEMPSPIIRPPNGSPLPRWLQVRVHERDPNIRLRASQPNHSPHQPYAYPAAEPEPIFTYHQPKPQPEIPFDPIPQSPTYEHLPHQPYAYPIVQPEPLFSYHQPQPQPQPELSFDPTPAYEPPIVETTESTECPIWDHDDEGFCDEELLGLTYSNPNPSPTYESPVVEIIEFDECPKWDYDDDEEPCDGELLELIYATPTPPEPTTQALHSAEIECPLSPPAQDPIILKPVEPISVISDDSNFDSSDFEVDPDPIEPIVHVLESKSLIFRNAQFKEAVEPSQLPNMLDLPSHLLEEPSPPESPAISKSKFPAISKAEFPVIYKAKFPATSKSEFPAISKSETPAISKAITPATSKSIISLTTKSDLIHRPLIAPIDKSTIPPSSGPQHHVNPSPLASVRSIVSPMTCFSITASLLTDPSVREQFLSAENLWQVRRHSCFQRLLIDAEDQWYIRRHSRFKLEKNLCAVNVESDHSSIIPLKFLQFEPR
ncbi:hypothetical protein QJS10_CPA03g01598 [Acorus calamus]|uniref:Uncharacterized protein n=1 Tax=Acorus calamus TaxID=4465 RepID=A0AAV9F9S2_ACOCL|nr:hypothetical protein QJS10_CPA03g01598 [Acorus calamus]